MRHLKILARLWLKEIFIAKTILQSLLSSNVPFVDANKEHHEAVKCKTGLFVMHAMYKRQFWMWT